MKITYSKNRFVIECAFSENHIVKGIPSVRFDRRRAVWSAQNLNRVCAYLMENLRQYLTPELVAVCEETLKKTRVTYAPFPSWYRFKTKPYKKQKEALDYSYNLRRNAFFMEMGTGKSKVALDLYACRMIENKIDCLVIYAPVNIKKTWANKQIPTHFPIDVPVFVLPEGNAKAALKMAHEARACDRFILIVGLESLQGKERGGSAYDAVVTAINGRRYGAVVDESHFVKGPDSNRSKNVKHLNVAAEYMTIMTGTPQSQGFIDLYMQFEVMDPNILGFGDFYSFRSRYAIMGGYEGREIVGYENVEELMDLITPFTFQCTKEEVLDLPPKIKEVVYVQLSDEQKEMYRKIDKEMQFKLPTTEEEVEVFIEHQIVKYGMLQQVVGGFIYYDDLQDMKVWRGRDGEERSKAVRKAMILVPPEKNPKIRELIRVAKEHKDTSIIVWAKFRPELDMIKQALEAEFGPGCCSEYHGGIPSGLREEEERKFTSRQTRFMLSNQQTGGAGTTWIESELTFYYSNGFRLIDREQSEDRNHRIGTKNKVVYLDAVAEGTVDEEIIAAIEDKKDMADYLRTGLRKRLLERINSRR